MRVTSRWYLQRVGSVVVDLAVVTCDQVAAALYRRVMGGIASTLPRLGGTTT